MRWLAGFLILAVAAGALVVYAGWYDISATDQHLRPTYWLLDTAMKRSIRWRAAKIPVPDLGDPKQVERGAGLYRAHCVQCHGATPGAPWHCTQWAR